MTSQPLLILVAVACIAVAAILIWGVSLFGKGADPKKSNKVMQLRIAAQFGAVIVIVIVALLLNRGG